MINSFSPSVETRVGKLAELTCDLAEFPHYLDKGHVKFRGNSVYMKNVLRIFLFFSFPFFFVRMINCYEYR